VRDQVFPAIVPGSNNDFVEGIVIEDILPNELSALDYFEDEGEMYARLDVNVELVGGDDATSAAELSTNIDAQTYVWIESLSQISVGELWDYDRFRKDSLSWYLPSTVLPCRRDIDGSKKEI